MSGENGPLVSLYSNLSITEKLAWGVVIGLYLLALSISIAYLISSVLTQELQRAGLWASIVSGLATVGLVVVTGFYVVYTRNLVGISEKARREELEHRNEQRERSLDSLRRALLQEIRAMENLHELSRNYEPGFSAFRQLVPSTVYEANAADIGRLTSNEIEAVVDYYTVASMVNDLLALQRDRDTKIGMGIFEEVYRAISFNWFFDRNSRKARTESTAERIGDLAEAQSDAIRELEHNLDQASNDDDA